MVLHWNKEKYQRVNIAVTSIFFATIAGVMFTWYFDAIPSKMLVITILPVGLAHWYKLKLDKLFKAFGGAQIAVEKNRLILSKPDQDFEASIRFREILSVQSTHWLFLDKMKLYLKGNREVVLVNFRDQKSILSLINH
ncbi:MAG: hypothetical protein ABW185_02995 [Sedimenticola sp.]